MINNILKTFQCILYQKSNKSLKRLCDKTSNYYLIYTDKFTFFLFLCNSYIYESTYSL